MPRQLGGIHDRDRYVSVQCGTRAETIDIGTIQTYLPEAEQIIGHGARMNMDHYIASSRPVIEGILTYRVVEEISQEFLKCLRRDYAGSQEIDRTIAHWLDQNAHEDDYHTPSRIRRLDALSTFLCLADISRRFGSPRIANVLSRFFSMQGEAILRAETSRTVLLWAWAILISEMSEREQLAFLQKFIRLRPEVVLDERYYTHANVPESRRLWRVFMRAMGDGDRGHERGRGGGGHERGRRGRSRSRIEAWRYVRTETRSRSRHRRIGGRRVQLIDDGRGERCADPPRGCRGRDPEVRDLLEDIRDGQVGLRYDVGHLAREMRRMGRPAWYGHHSIGWDDEEWIDWSGDDGSIDGMEVCFRW